jgi:hypothetical protein
MPDYLAMVQSKLRICKIVILLFFSTHLASAQIVNQAVGLQDSLSMLSTRIWKQKSDTGKLSANEAFFLRFRSALRNPNSLKVPLDSIKGITRVADEKGNLRIFTWNVPLADGSNKYFGFVQLAGDSLRVFSLRSKSIEAGNFEDKQLSADQWYGAIYYGLISGKIAGQQAYTLLGWDGYTSGSNRKLIEILTFDKQGNLQFGLPVFKTDHGLKSRVVKEYAEKATMTLRYDYQSILVQKGKKVKKDDTWLIVMDRLVPMDPTMRGFYKYYVAAGDTYDGFVFRDGFWSFVEDVEVVNRALPVKK